MRTLARVGAIGAFFALSFLFVQRTDAQLAPPEAALSVGKLTHVADGADVQTVTLTVTSTDPGGIDRVRIYINYENTAASPRRGHFEWTPSLGFRERGADYGNDYVNLLPTGIPLDPSEATIDPVSGRATFVFSFKADPTYGTISDNDISYSFRIGTQNYNSGLVHAETNYAVDAEGYVAGGLPTLRSPKPLSAPTALTSWARRSS